MKILFVCKGNMFRSPIAEAIAGKLIGKENVLSAGTYTGAPDEPEGQRLLDIHHHGIFCRFMEDQGYKGFGEYRTQKVTEDMIQKSDVVVDMAEDPYDLEILKNNPKVIRWTVENPYFQNLTDKAGYEKAREIYGILKAHIKELILAKKA